MEFCEFFGDDDVRRTISYVPKAYVGGGSNARLSLRSYLKITIQEYKIHVTKIYKKMSVSTVRAHRHSHSPFQSRP